MSKIQRINGGSPTPESEASSELPVYSTSGFFSFLKAWNPSGESRRRDKGKGPAVGAPIPPNPKVFFANERTFLSWMNCGLAVGLLNFGDRVGQIAGLIFGLIAIVLMFYALVQFWSRADRLQEKEKGNRFEDMSGSLILVSVIFLGVGINFGLRFMSGDKL
ncbi:hypothetical protein PhCBS80983_g00337 [Powellomyces hirtus]|uniref:DUF202 domain-containing protein n=1 Tax=Powellomyces hirtus TaxID=109895 RepID=A0A507EH06_9FUNG|nr:hypothetical protein PhCBS80983_g00337 [Powellomyces hirtus]